MKLEFWCMLTLPMMAAFLALYFFSKHYPGTRWGLVAKCGGSYVAVATVAAGYYSGGKNPFSQPLFWGLLLCTVADALLEIRFPLGVICFGLGHGAFIAWLLGYPLSTWSLLLFAPVYLFQFWFFKKDLQKKPGNKLPYYLYPIVLIAMGAIGAMLPFTAGPALLLPALGAVLFVFSDFLVATDFLRGSKKGPRAKALACTIMISYYAALYLLALSPWVSG